VAITDAGDIMAILEGSRAVAAAIPGMASAYVLTPTVGPDQLKLPSAIQHLAVQGIEPAEIDYSASQEIVDHFWLLDVLVARSGDLQGDTEAAAPFIPKVLQAYREQMALGCAPVVHRSGPTSYQLVTVALGAETYMAVRFVMRAHAKAGVTLAAGA